MARPMSRNAPPTAIPNPIVDRLAGDGARRQGEAADAACQR